MSITLEQAKALKVGDILYHVSRRNADGTPQRWKVNGIPRTWVRKPGRVQVPVKHGLYSYGYLISEDLWLVCLTAEEALESK